MNINFVCVARHPAAELRLSHAFPAVVEDAQAIFGEAIDHQWTDGRVALFNADRARGTWGVPTWHEDGGEIFAVSQPPVPVNDTVDPESYWTKVTELIRRGELSQLLPNHFGVHRHSDGSVSIWTDMLGIGRCYYVVTDDFVAASNHIGVLTHFLDGDVQVDFAAVSRYVQAGWFTLDDSPFIGIKRLREGCKIDVGCGGSVDSSQYSDLTDLVERRDAMPDYDSVVAQTRAISWNLNKLSVRTPTVYLSGGRDSRMTASVWLSGGSSASVKTLGTLAPEAEIAKDLIAAFSGSEQVGQAVQHDITVPKSSSITMPLSERFDNAFKMWDGDAGPTNIKGNVRVPGRAAGLSIGGLGGEIMHGYYYHREGDLERVARARHPLAFAARNFRGPLVTEEASSAMEGFTDIIYDRAVGHGRPDIAALDYLYLTEKFRRWGNQSLNSTSAIMLAAPAYIRACFDLTAEQRVKKVFPEQVVRRAIPEWHGIRYYKAQIADSKKSMKKKLATYDTDPEYVRESFESPRAWPQYFQEDKIREYLELVQTDEALPVHESWLNRAMWVDHLDEHAAKLTRRAQEAKA